MTDLEPTTKAIQVKLVLLGEAAVGKSSLVLRFVQDDFNENNSPTIGAAFLTQKCRLEDKIIKFEIWDTAGQERFHSLAPMYYRNAAAAVVVYDITKSSSLEKAKAWVNELQRQANPNIVIALVGNKLDLITEGTGGSATASKTTGVRDSTTTTAAAGSPVSPFAKTGSDKSNKVTTTGTDDEAGRVDEDEPTGANDAQERQSDDDDDDDDDEEGEEMSSFNKASGEVDSAGKDVNARQVSREEAEGYAKEAGGLLFFEASAKTGKGVQEIFTEIAKNLPMDSIAPKTTTTGAQAGSRRAAGANSTGSDSNRVNLGEQGQKAKGGCC